MLKWVENAEFSGRQCSELKRSCACYGAPRAGGVLFGWLRDSQWFIDDNRAMRGADDDLQLGLCQIGRNVGRERTRNRMRGHRKGDREQQEGP